ncbi:hypothetical protein SODALDRAFT_362858 [Sodiomyces alkalinus F11]|uniref:DUF1996 domain-containing protein n=1 Tax=Sodiomyces alkalinus (strain CBS 110278 / VKM F-3762 / F11) TaxID=1314773 RepID=A0A3N2PN97_SODAK|nr:hypothetical protein SODALDRAFT_362858 [Sodiomyces alkalinus F11]ROT35998.1 hypothetical protein SODALDRAFT_362858 [Sodiomyces alkalinus F11]
MVQGTESWWLAQTNLALTNQVPAAAECQMQVPDPRNLLSRLSTIHTFIHSRQTCHFVRPDEFPPHCCLLVTSESKLLRRPRVPFFPSRCSGISIAGPFSTSIDGSSNLPTSCSPFVDERSNSVHKTTHSFLTTAILAGLAGGAYAAHEGGFAVLHFHSSKQKEIARGRVDPIVTPGGTAQHVHGAMGASGFSRDATGQSLKRSRCTNSRAKEDLSSYWFPWLYFHDEETDTFEPVDISYVNVYYFFDRTNDDIKAFPTGLQFVAGNASTRVSPGTHGRTNIDPSKGTVQPVQWTCPRANSNYDNPPSWPLDSDGSLAGERNPRNHGAGTGFPSVDCDGKYSPLRADVHMPSCYNPEAGLDAHKTNSAYPSDAGDGRVDCPEGWIHVPHMFYEVYWDTPKFRERWPSHGQPFVLSNGDVSGYSLHADFMAAWDEDALQTAIDNCNVGHAGLHTCPGITENTVDDCVGEFQFQELVTGVLDTLPGNLPLQGWSYGVDNGGGAGSIVDDVLPEPVETVLPIHHAPELDDARPTPVFSTIQEPESPEPTPAPESQPEPAPEPVQEPVEEEPVQGEPEPEPTTSCKKKAKTVWETVTVTATATQIVSEPAPTPLEKMRRHVHHHALRHRSLRK